MADALAKVKKDLGKDAVILHTRTLTRGGILGLGARSVIEITATADERVMAVRKAAAATDNSDELPSPGPSSRMTPLFDYAAAEAVGRTAPRHGLRGMGKSVTQSGESRVLVEPKDSRRPQETDTSALRIELDEIRGMVRDLVKHVQKSDGLTMPDEFAVVHSMLLSRDVDPDLAADLIARTAERLQTHAALQGLGRIAAQPEATPDLVLSELRKTIADMLPPAAPLRLREDAQPAIVALVGPTGVGKTTTIAKLAANMKLREGKRVGLITIDSYRIAAVEQLRTYAQILRVPVVSVIKPDDLRPAIDQMRDLDLILIDTAGRSQKDGMRIAELNEFIRIANPDQIHLVLSTTSREKTIREAIDRFGSLGDVSLLFTKLDEAEGLGAILNVMHDLKLSASYLTTGQAVPDDIEIASASRVARLIVGEADPQAVPAEAGRPNTDEGTMG